MASARLSGWRRAQRGEREKIGQGPGRRRGERARVWCSVCLGGEPASEWCACPFPWTPQFLVVWGCAGGGALEGCKFGVCEEAAISFCVQK